jgi:protein-S-isoprenylcysteine O-methyltransferase Ste14
MNKLWASIVMAVTALVGALSLLGFLVFLFAGPFGWIDLGLGNLATLLLDGLLCLAFFVQHSVMIRKSFRRYLSAMIPSIYHGALYTLMSGIFLLALLMLWQETGTVLLSLGGVLKVLARAVFFAAVIVFTWGASSLSGFDTFGLRPIRAGFAVSPVSAPRLMIRGPYRWVRHPLYSCILVFIWSHPHITTDRLWFNLLWTCWIVIGTWLEERDLVAEFGQKYSDYQKDVPMLVPWKGPAGPVSNPI